ncbi:elongation factor TS [Batrachochytrium dendrobatidis JEL423]|uniref:Elongation factor Ts, mitochondrial n=1 Tax=Batrachochytrium dendrobatidis (strain JEL423) TaxID=403673 RepID=A0A177WWS9_BATDL|nr:elongation factor TS [Batrachochytrium dendrobatidis JEL423]
MVSRLRKETQCALSKAKDALVAIKAEIHPGTDQQIYDDALAWLHKDMAESGAKKAAKVSNRVTAEGLVGVFCDPRYGRHAAMVEINSETDFVSKSELFSKLVESLHASPIHEIDRSMILQSSMVASDTLSIQTAFADVIGKLGENLQLRRALLALQPFNSTHITSDHQQRVFGVYAHAAEKTKIAGLGKFAAVVSLTSAEPKVDLAESQILRMAIFANKLAQHITGFSPTSIYATPFHTDNNSQETPATSSEDVLMTQQFLFGGGTVLEVLNALSKEIKAKIVVEAFTRYACGEGIEKKPDNFVDEVMKQASQ